MVLDLGGTYITRGVDEKFNKDDLVKCLARHARGDWGNVSSEDWKLNDDALKEGGRVLSAYNLPQGKIWIITESDRSTTTILLPDEY